MYGNNLPVQFGATSASGAAIGQTVASGIASKLAASGASFVAASIPAIASAAGPIGFVVGAIVSVLMSIFKFGPKPKDPIYGVGVAVPRSDPVARVKRVLGLLEKPMVSANACWGMPNHDDARCLSLFAQIKAIFEQGEKGAMIISSGGTPEAQRSVLSSDFGPTLQKMKEFTDPFRTTLQLILNPDIKKRIEEYDLGYVASRDYHLWIPHQQTNPPCSTAFSQRSNWCRQDIVQNYLEVLVTKTATKSLSQSLNNGLTNIGQQINKAFIEHAGWDVILGKVTNEEKAKLAFTAPASLLTSSIGGTGIPAWVLLLGGIVLLTDRSAKSA